MTPAAPSGTAIAAWSARTDQRLAKTASPRSRKRLPKKLDPLRTGHPGQVYDAVTGRPVKQPDREKVEKRLRLALKRLDTTHESGLALSRALDVAELADVPARHPLVERAATALASWEGAQP